MEKPKNEPKVKTEQQKREEDMMRDLADMGIRVSGVKQVTRETWKFEVGVPKALKFLSKIHEGKNIEKTGGSKEERKKPAMVATVLNLRTGEECEIIVGAVLMGVLSEQYPNDAYLGKSFWIVQNELAGKDYKGYKVLELVTE